MVWMFGKKENVSVVGGLFERIGWSKSERVVEGFELWKIWEVGEVDVMFIYHQSRVQVTVMGKWGFAWLRVTGSDGRVISI